MTSPFSSALRALYRQRDDYRAKLEKVNQAIAALEPLHGSALNPTAIDTPTTVAVGTDEFKRLSVGDGATAVLKKVGHTLPAAEIRTLLQRGGKAVEYRHLYNTLMKRKRTIYRDEGRFGLKEWQSGGSQ